LQICRSRHQYNCPPPRIGESEQGPGLPLHRRFQDLDVPAAGGPDLAPVAAHPPVEEREPVGDHDPAGVGGREKREEAPPG